MIKGQKVIVVLPIYSAEKTLLRKYAEVPLEALGDH